MIQIKIHRLCTFVSVGKLSKLSQETVDIYGLNTAAFQSFPVHNMQFSIRLGMAEESAHNKDKKQFIKK